MIDSNLKIFVNPKESAVKSLSLTYGVHYNL